MKIIDSIWDAERRLLITQLKGKVDSEDVHRWKDSLTRELSRIEDSTTFKLVSDLHGYEPTSTATT